MKYAMIRLDAILITGLPQISKADVPGFYQRRVNCVLHGGKLSEHQELEVLVNGVLQTGVNEGNQSVFTWQFFQASDEVRITLLSRGTRMKHWQGCWNERDAILYAGTLLVQVFFDGKPQPLLETTIAPVSSAALANVSSSLAETVNGSKQIGTVVLDRAREDSSIGGGSEVSRGDQSTLIVQDLLVIAASGHSSEIPQEREENSTEDQQEEIEEEVIDDETDQWEEEEDTIEESEAAQWEEGKKATDRDEIEDDDKVPFVANDEMMEKSGYHDELHNLSKEDAQRHPVTAATTGRYIAAFHASPLAVEETLQSLENMVATMPSKTLIVDVRPKNRQKKKYQTHGGLSKQLLRSVFGAKFWDRGWAIQITAQVVPLGERVGVSTWRYVVNTSDRHPDGIPSLAKKLEEGYSIIVIDSIAIYGESRRRAIIEELQQCVSDLYVGPLQ